MISREHEGRFVILITLNWNHENCFVNLNLYTTFNAYCPDNKMAQNTIQVSMFHQMCHRGQKKKSENIFGLIPLLWLTWRKFCMWFFF